MALNLFAPIVTALTGAAKAYTTLNEAKNKTQLNQVHQARQGV